MTSLIREITNTIDELSSTPINLPTLHHWLSCFHHGQTLIADRAGVLPTRINYCLGFVDSITGQLNPALAGYDERQQQINLSLSSLAGFLELHELRHQRPVPLITSASLYPLGVYFPIGNIPLITAAEEQSHAVYHTKIKDRMGWRNRVTHHYDGSDTWENHAVRGILSLAIDHKLTFFDQNYQQLQTDQIRAIRRNVKLTPRIP